MKNLNTISYILNAVLLIVIVAMAARSCNPKAADVEEVKDRIMQAEQRRLPLTIQYMGAESITIDNIVLYTERKPWTGYLETTWTEYYTTKKKYIELSVRPGRGRYNANWSKAKYQL